MDLAEDYREFLRLLISHRVRFLVVGAHALAALGHPRYSDDLDVFVEATPANARRIVAALRAFGFGDVGLDAEDFSRPGKVARLGQPPVSIDVLTSIAGVSFAEAWKGRTRGRLAGLTVAYLGKQQFVRNKRAAGRPKDLLDLALLDEGKRRR
jgi:hypothetical protein